MLDNDDSFIGYQTCCAKRLHNLRVDLGSVRWVEIDNVELLLTLAKSLQGRQDIAIQNCLVVYSKRFKIGFNNRASAPRFFDEDRLTRAAAESFNADGA